TRRSTMPACTAISSACSPSTWRGWTCPTASPPPMCCARCRATCWPKPRCMAPTRWTTGWAEHAVTTAVEKIDLKRSLGPLYRPAPGIVELDVPAFPFLMVDGRATRPRARLARGRGGAVRGGVRAGGRAQAPARAGLRGDAAGRAVVGGRPVQLHPRRLHRLAVDRDDHAAARGRRGPGRRSGRRRAREEGPAGTGPAPVRTVRRRALRAAAAHGPVHGRGPGDRAPACLDRRALGAARETPRDLPRGSAPGRTGKAEDPAAPADGVSRSGTAGGYCAGINASRPMPSRIR